MPVTAGEGAARAIGVDAYLYLYPLVMMDITRGQATRPGGGGGLGGGPLNRFSHLRAFPAAGFTAVVRPNFDTLYSSAWVDLSDGPVVLSTGPVPADRFFQLPVYDMWTDAFASPGTRTTGSDAGQWALIPPGWTGRLPDGVGAIDAPTPTVWIIGRTQTNGPADYGAVHAVQDRYALTPLAAWGDRDGAGGPIEPSSGTSRTDVDRDTDTGTDRETPPLHQLAAMPVDVFFDRALALMAVHPPHATDWSLIARMTRIGLVPGARFAGLDPGVRSALADVPAGAQALMAKALPRLANVVNGWQVNLDTMGVYGNSYVKRAIVAMIGLGANAAEDALYPVLQTDADGQGVRGERDYLLHFDADGLPPVDAFWSVTMYDGQGFHAGNPLDRFALGDRDELSFNPDGSLDLYLQHETPGPDLESNWLPSPEGPIGVTMRLYAPKPTALDGTWSPPPVRRRA